MAEVIIAETGRDISSSKVYACLRRITGNNVSRDTLTARKDGRKVIYEGRLGKVIIGIKQNPLFGLSARSLEYIPSENGP